MTTTKTLLGSVAAALVAALTIAAGTASASDGPTITVGTGCAAQCITKAVVTTTTTTAKVEIETTVLAHLRVSVRKQTAWTPGGDLASPETKTVLISAFSQSRVASFYGLEPDTTYAIAVRATDLKGQVAWRKGTFKTLPVKTTGQTGATGIDSGLGCSAQCITKVQIIQKPPVASVALVDIATSENAKIQIVVSRDKPVETANGLAQFEVVSNQISQQLTKSFKVNVGGLAYGTRYYVVVRAKDDQGRMNVRQGSFRTVKATATVTVHKVKVVNDGDKVGKGELFFGLYLGDDVYAAWGTGLMKLDSGDVFDVRRKGTTRTGFSFEVPANGDAKFEMEMLGQECDAALKKNCILEAGRYPSLDQYAWAGGTFDISDLLAKGALPPWYGTGVTPPAGHDGYFVFGTGNTYVKYFVMATIDLRVDWP
jgi:hypothetical protein